MRLSTIIEAINLSLIAFFRFDLVGALFGGQSAFLSRVVFGLVGISALDGKGKNYRRKHPVLETLENNEGKNESISINP